VGFFPCDVHADGRFLVVTPVNTETPVSTPVTIALNWQAGFTHR